MTLAIVSKSMQLCKYKAGSEVIKQEREWKAENQKLRNINHLMSRISRKSLNFKYFQSKIIFLLRDVDLGEKNRAALKIQSRYRGNKSRQKV